MKIIIACIPAAVLGLLLDDWMEAHLYNAYVVAAMLILYGILFIVLENSPITSSPSIQKVGQISVKTGFLIGVFQLLSLIPGTSRSGSTILGAMILGCSRSAAAEFSFFLGIPVMFGASFLKIVKFFLDGNSFTGSQAGFMTDTQYGAAHIRAVKPDRVKAAIGNGEIAIVAGFQGVNSRGDATTLGRGGSDTSAVALAVALGADVCEIYTDVDGVFTADPRIVPTAQRIESITYDAILEMAASGSKVLALRCVEYARRFQMPIHVRSSFSKRKGTIVLGTYADLDSIPNRD